MGVKKILDPYKIMNAVAVSSTNTYTSSAVSVKNLDNVGLQIGWTGTNVGTFTVQVSPDGVLYDDLVFNPVLTQPAGASGRYGVNLNQLPFQWVRVKYVNASSTGTVTVMVTGKDIN